MKADAIGFGIAGVAFGLVAGWVIGSQQPRGGAVAAPGAPIAAAAAAAAPAAPATAALDRAKVSELMAQAQRESANADVRAQLGNLYFDAERYSEAISWYEESLRLRPKDVNVSTDLGVSYYYTNQPDKALAQFDKSLEMDGRHAKTLLNVGVVRAFGKQDLAGAEAAWQQVLAIAPDGPEGQAAKRALDSLRSVHQSGATPPKPGA